MKDLGNKIYGWTLALGCGAMLLWMVWICLSWLVGGVIDGSIWSEIWMGIKLIGMLIIFGVIVNGGLMILGSAAFWLFDKVRGKEDDDERNF